MKTYEKKPLTFDEQLLLISKRGLIIEDHEKAINSLKHISYYRLSAFYVPYQKLKDTFNTGTTFEIILETYSFDRDLRILIFDCIERIEIAIRTQIIYTLSIKYENSHWQDDSNIFKRYKSKNRVIDPHYELQKIITKSSTIKNREMFIEHYIDTYNEPINPPSWMCLELLTIGELSRLFIGLKNSNDKQNIADYFGLPTTVFISWLHTLTYVRNICAHHSRLWNRTYAITPNILQKPRFSWIGKLFENNKRTFYFLCTIQYLLKSANISSQLKIKLEDLINKYPSVSVKYIGLPTNGEDNLLDWKSEPLWN
ncbi:MAG: Abi family protein [Bacteroidia bacterium]|nr:Abi family protein [Bacteroidia bacterium]